uniref:Putative ovule protein n=1 Tax=Solanum chacoense TaxID=4108 RepID=A0A0V0H425_SOLCH
MKNKNFYQNVLFLVTCAHAAYYICDASMCINLLIILLLFLKVFLMSSSVSIPYIARNSQK